MIQPNTEEKEKPEDQSEESLRQAKGEQSQAKEIKEERAVQEVPLEHMKKADLLEKVKEVQATADKNYEVFLRSQAEIENLKKRFQKERIDLIKFSTEALIKQLLKVIDSLEKAIAATQSENPMEGVKEGLELTLKGFMDTLEKSGLTVVQPEGQPFDPNFHEAITAMEDNNVKPGTVLHVHQKGYILNERLIRPAMVVVSKKTET